MKKNRDSHTRYVVTNKNNFYDIWSLTMQTAGSNHQEDWYTTKDYLCCENNDWIGGYNLDQEWKKEIIKIAKYKFKSNNMLDIINNCYLNNCYLIGKEDKVYVRNQITEEQFNEYKKIILLKGDKIISLLKKQKDEWYGPDEYWSEVSSEEFKLD